MFKPLQMVLQEEAVGSALLIRVYKKIYNLTIQYENRIKHAAL